MTIGEENLKMIRKQFAMIEELNNSFDEPFSCEGVKCRDCPYHMGNKELPFRGETTGCAYAAMSEILRKIVNNSFQKT